jgi:hypothetical protein
MRVDYKVIYFIFFFELFACFLFAQSSAENVESLKAELDSIVTSFAQDLKSTVHNPDLLIEGKIQKGAANAVSSIQSLSSKIDGAADIISRKESNLATTGLSINEKKELASILAAQKKPLTDLRAKSLIIRKKIESIEQSELESWKQTFSAYESVKGKEEASQKLSGSIKTSLSGVPDLLNAYSRANSSPPPSPVKQANQKSPNNREVPPPKPQNSASGSTEQNALNGLIQDISTKVSDANNSVNSGHESKSQVSTDSSKSLTNDETEVLLGGAFVLLLWIVFLALAGKKSTGPGSAGNIFCALNSLALPGLGQLAQRRIGAGLLFVVTSIVLWTIYLGWIIHLWAAVNAARWAPPSKPV